MAYSRALFNTETLAILNMIDPDETITYDWSIDEDYSIVLVQGSIRMHDNTTLAGVNEYRVQPNTNLVATGLGSARSYFISLFKIDGDSVADQIVTEANKTRMRTFAPTWYSDGLPPSPTATWEPDFVSGDYTYTTSILNSQVSVSEWN